MSLPHRYRRHGPDLVCATPGCDGIGQLVAHLDVTTFTMAELFALMYEHGNEVEPVQILANETRVSFDVPVMAELTAGRGPWYEGSAAMVLLGGTLAMVGTVVARWFW